MLKSVLVAGLAAGLAVGVAPSAEAATNDLAALVRYSPGATTTSLDRAVHTAMKSTGKSRATVIAQALAEARASAAEARATPVNAKAATGTVTILSSGGGTRTLGSATAKGDVFVSPASTLFIQHGHTGIYYALTAIVEAPGSGQKSRSISASSVTVGTGTVKQHVAVTQTKRDAAGAYAYSNLRGKEYNTNFAFNRDAYGTKMNCSQLVWAAYTIKAGIDLDSNGGFGVYPYNIKDSSLTSTYSTLS